MVLEPEIAIYEKIGEDSIILFQMLEKTNNRWLINPLNITIPVPATQCLQLGPKFYYPVSPIPAEKIITDAEYA